MSTHAATQSDVALAAGVSRSLVSLALAGSPKVARETRERIEKVARDLGYRVNVAASSLARQSSSIIGLVLPNLRNAFFERMARCLNEAASQRGMTLFVTVGSEDPVALHRAIDSLLGVRVAGIAMVSPWLSGQDVVAVGEEVATCVIGRRSPGGRIDAVHIDERAAAGLVVDHLKERGASSLVYVRPRAGDETSRHEREIALADAAAEAGLPLAVHGCADDAGPAVRAAVSTHPEPLGLVMHNDVLAIDAVPALRTAHRDEDSPVLIASYDNTYLAQREEFSLTSINQPEPVMAAQAIELICRRAGLGAQDALAADEPARSVVLAPTLAIRSSSAQ